MLNKITFVIFYYGSFKVNVLVESFLETQLNIKLSNSKKKICFALPSPISKYKNDSFSRNTNIVTRMVQSDAFYTYF